MKILKSIVIGALFGTAAYFMPKLIIGMFLFFAITRLFMSKRCGKGKFGTHRLAFMDKVRSMTEEEYTNFKNSMSNGCCGHSCATK